jgi:acetyl esterase
MLTEERDMKRTTLKAPNLTLDTKKFIDALAAQKMPPIYELSYKDARKVLQNAQKMTLPSTLKNCDVQDVEFPVGPTGSVDARILKPKGAKGKLPVVMYFHGGGWVLGDKSTHDRLLRTLCTKSGMAFVFVNYTPSPEAQYPVPIEQAYAATKYVADNAKKLGFDADKLVVAGDSVGGNMAAVMTLMSAARKGPKISFQILIYPVTSAAMDTRSYKDFADGPWLTAKAMSWFWDAYLPDKKKRMEIFASPLNATVAQLKGLPPAFVITDENDVLRDEGEEYASKLMSAGVEVAAVRYGGTIHDFVMLNALANTAPAKAAVCQIADVLRCKFA